jgi:N-acetylglutamate kinase (EC 2.7.2.8)/N2-acetyl-L-aminoadipate kinase (EC 2.7.2.-)
VSKHTEDSPIVVKIGGARAVEPAGAIEDIASRIKQGQRVVVVHGGSTAVDDTLKALGKEPTYVETPRGVSGRFTDADTMDVFNMVLPGKLNTELTVELRNADIDAIGLSGIDGGLLTGKRKSAVRIIEDGRKRIKRGDHSGKITDVNSSLLNQLIGIDLTPVVTVPIFADDGVAVNADADRAAAAIAGALSARLILLSDVAGVYRDPEDASTRIEQVKQPGEFEELRSVAEGFMYKKVIAAHEALNEGASEVIIADANQAKPVKMALDGDGTEIFKRAVDTESQETSE